MERCRACAGPCSKTGFFAQSALLESTRRRGDGGRARLSLTLAHGRRVTATGPTSSCCTSLPTRSATTRPPPTVAAAVAHQGSRGRAARGGRPARNLPQAERDHRRRAKMRGRPRIVLRRFFRARTADERWLISGPRAA
jgi:hypothetical protein